MQGLFSFKLYGIFGEGNSMNAIYIDSTNNDDHRRELLYKGQLIVHSYPRPWSIVAAEAYAGLQVGSRSFAFVGCSLMVGLPSRVVR